HSIARLDRALHAARSNTVVGVLAGEEHPAVERRRDERQHAVALVADRRSHDRARPWVMRPALHEPGHTLDRPAYHRGHGGVDVVEDLRVGHPRWLDVARGQAGDDDVLAWLVHGLLLDES